MLSCPLCQQEVNLRNVKRAKLFQSERECPHCGGLFTVDSATKRRQAIFLVLAVVALAVTMLLYYEGTEWLIPALVVYGIDAVYLYWANQKVYLVPPRSR